MAAITSSARRSFAPVPVVTGIAFTLSWIIGLAIPAPSPRLTASGATIVTELAGHGGQFVANVILTEGLPAIGLAVISAYLARHTRHPRWVLGAGVFAAVVSLTQCALGLALARATAPATAHLLYEAVNRLDGVKMFAIAAVALAAGAAATLPRWLRWLGIALGISIAASGVAYLFLLDSVAWLAYVAGMLLLIFIPAAGIVEGRACREPA
jgi:hypothetical protein